MKNFLEQVENLLRKKKERELKAIVMGLASKLAGKEQQEFLDMLEDKRLRINKDAKSKPNTEAKLEYIRKFLARIEDYEIEAYYHDSYRWDDDDEGWNIEEDDGFAKDMLTCYEYAESLLIHGLYNDAAMAFRLMFDAIDKFDEIYESHEYGELYVETFIDEGLLDINMKKAKAYRGYSALMAQDSADFDLEDELDYVFGLCSSYTSKIAFGNVLDAGSEPVPNREKVLEEWVEVLLTKHPIHASPLVKEAACLAKNLGIMERFVNTSGAKEPVAYLDLIHLWTEHGVEDAKIIAMAKRGLENTLVDARQRSQLASMLVEMAKDIDYETYVFALVERFITVQNVDTYIPVYELNKDEANKKALAHVTPPKSHSGYIIHFINGSYDMVFDKVQADKESLGWSSSLKGHLYPLFMGALAGFSKEAIAIAGLVGNSALYDLLAKAYSPPYEAQQAKWYDWCVSEAQKRADAIVSNQHRGAYSKAAELIAAVCELRSLRGEKEPMSLADSFLAKYPRHTSFKAEMRASLDRVKRQIQKNK